MYTAFTKKFSFLNIDHLALVFLHIEFTTGKVNRHLVTRIVAVLNMFLCKIFFLLLEKYSNNHRHNYLVLNGCSQACRYHSSCLSCYHLRLLADSEFYIAPQVWHRGMKMSESYVIGLFEKRKGTLIFPRTKL